MLFIWWYSVLAPVMIFRKSYPDWQGKKLFVFADPLM